MATTRKVKMTDYDKYVHEIFENGKNVFVVGEWNDEVKKFVCHQRRCLAEEMRLSDSVAEHLRDNKYSTKEQALRRARFIYGPVCHNGD
jgi:UDP-N-acetylmuramoylalanine-D-glutamate ligase